MNHRAEGDRAQLVVVLDREVEVTGDAPLVVTA